MRSPAFEVVYDKEYTLTLPFLPSSDLCRSAGFSNFSSRHVTMATRKSSRGSRQVGHSFEGVRLSPASRERGTRPGLSEELFEDKSNLD